MPAQRPSDPDAATSTKYRSPNELADAIICAGCRVVQAEDMHEHGNRLLKGGAGSQAQSIMERLHQVPEPRAAQLVRQLTLVRAEWMQGDEQLNRLADRVLALGLAEEAAPPTSEAGPPTPETPEATARRVLDVARRRLAAAEGNHVASGGAAAEVDAAYDTFDPPIRRHALADIVLHRLQRASGARQLARLDPVPEAAMESEA
ncbi:hypothetical protein ABPG77_001232 [Micractinium sp. CCAP 211/92]